MRATALQIQSTLNNIASLFGLVANRVPNSITVPNEVICNLAARHHGLPNGDFLFRPGKCLKLSKIRNKYPPIIAYEETRGTNSNDIWLGHLRFAGYYTLLSDSTRIVDSPELPTEEVSYTLFVFPYQRLQCEEVTNLLSSKWSSLDPLDIQSLGFCSASTGSSRLFRNVSEILTNFVAGNAKLSPLLLLDLLNCSSVVRYRMDCEKDVFSEISKGITRTNDDEEVKKTFKDMRILDKVALLFALRRSYNEISPIMVKTFSDFVCDRLEFIAPKIITNMVAAVGNSKSLDEFWMFMMAKRIQDTVNEYEPEDLATIIDTYATASLEDTGFYETVCERVKNSIEQFTPHQLAIILSALAKVRMRDVPLIESALEIIKRYLMEEYHSEIFANSSKSLYKRDLSQDILIIAHTLVATSELDYREDNLDLLWRILGLRLKDTIFDISVSNWIPFAIATYPSPTCLHKFLPIWMNHVSSVIRRIRSKTYVKTIQRRHALLLQCLRTGIIPKEFVEFEEMSLLKEICKNMDLGSIRHEEIASTFTPESSTFHLEVSACLRGLQVHHQKELQSVPFVLDIVIHNQTPINVPTSNNSRNMQEWSGYNLHHDRYSPNHRKHKRETYIFKPTE